jgi:hypothetical protein
MVNFTCEGQRGFKQRHASAAVSGRVVLIGIAMMLSYLLNRFRQSVVAATRPRTPPRGDVKGGFANPKEVLPPFFDHGKTLLLASVGFSRCSQIERQPPRD